MFRLLKFFMTLILCVILSISGTAQNIPQPEDVLGFKVGADYHLATYTEAIEYFKQLARSSNKIILFEAGKTSMGQTMTYAVISAPENLTALDKYKQIARQLSIVRGTSPENANTMAKQGKAVVYIDGGLHASECAPAQHNLQLAYDLLSRSDEWTQRILHDVILILVFANPDGMNLLSEWYHPNVGTPYEVSSMPRLYHIYSGHDNNRDSYIANLIETQHISRLVNQEWFPVILYNHHQTAPFPARIWTPPNSEPTNPNVHPLVVRWQNLIGSAMGAAFDAEGKEGAISRLIFDTWFPGYVTQVVDSHNIISILTETALYRYATPHFYTIRDFPQQYQDLTMSAFYPNPWKGGWWRLKDAVDYCVTASKAVLNTASKYREELLFNKYKMGSDVIKRFSNEPPYAWIIPEQQWDPGVVSLLLNRMILLGIEVYKSTEEFICDGILYPSGTHVIPMKQAFALFINNVFGIQKYPDLRKYPDLWQGIIRPKQFEGSPLSAYDQMGWTLPYQFGAHIKPANTPLEVNLTPIKRVQLQQGRISGDPGYAYVLSHKENASFTAMNKIIKNRGKVLWTQSEFSAGNTQYPAGTILVLAGSVNPDFMQKLASELDLNIKGISRRPGVKTWKIGSPRIGLYRSWIPNADEGWTRFILKNHDFPFSSLYDADIRAGSLRANYDVIVFPSTRRFESIISGHTKGTMPPKYIGGITNHGVLNLKQFAEAGGHLVFINGSCDFAIESFKIPVKNTLKNIKRSDFVCSGSILHMEFDTAHPLAYGMPDNTGTIFGSNCALEILPSFKKNSIPISAAKYPSDNLLMSGWIHGERHLHRKSTIVSVPYGKGNLILFGFPVQYRSQPYGTFKLLFNALFYNSII